MLKLKDLVKNYYVADLTVEALKGVNLCFRKNEFVSILGPSGCGKTTLLNIVGGLDKYTSGDVFINGKSTKEYTDRDWDVYRNHRIGFIFQSYNLIPHQTVLGNVELALTISGISKAERIEKAKKALDRVGLQNQYNKHPNQLSGGQCQRVAIARALVNEPEILLADEPTGALDTETSVQIMDLIKEIANEKLVIMVTHNPDLAYKYSTRIVKFLDGQLVDDSNPFSEEDEQKEIEEIQKEEQANYEVELAKIDKTDEKEIEEIQKEEQANYEVELAKIDKTDEKAIKKFKKGKNAKEKAKMSFWTAFKLSARNLWSKRARTLMVGIAGSIGIIGVASVLAVSTGVHDYINNMQDDLLSGNPIRVGQTAIDLNVLMDSSTFQVKAEALKQGDWVNVNKIIEYLLEHEEALKSIRSTNDINQDYINYVKSMPTEYYQSISLDYGIDIRNNLYTDYIVGTDDDYSVGPSGRVEKDFNGTYSLTAINAIYAAAITNLSDEFGQYSDVITSLGTPLSQCVPNNDYILSQYDLISGEMPKGKNDLILVVDEKSAISDLMLAQLGYYSQEQFYSLVYNASTIKSHIDFDKFKTKFSYEELLNRKYYWYPNDSVYTRTDDGTNPSVNNFRYNYLAEDISSTTGMEEMRVVGIVKPKKGVQYGALEVGLLYQEDFARHIIKTNKNSEIANLISNGYGGTSRAVSPIYTNINSIPEIDPTTIDPSAMGLYTFDYTVRDYVVTSDTTVEAGKKYYLKTATDPEFSISYNLQYYWEKLDEDKVRQGYKGIEAKFHGEDCVPLLIYDKSATAQILSMFGLDRILGNIRSLALSSVGGSSLPETIYVYPNNFKDKDLVTDYLDAWNSDSDVTIYEFDEDFNIQYNSDGSAKTYTLKAKEGSRESEIKYTDSVGVIIKLINTMINIVTYALVAFTALSLVVSSVMIAIITYVSVMERIKEIGVIRSLGGRKKDVSHLFNAETFIIGSAAGIIGIIVTGILCIIANIITAAASGGTVTSIAHLTIPTAIIMILVSILLTSISGLIPARSAAKKDPVVALRTE